MLALHVLGTADGRLAWWAEDSDLSARAPRSGQRAVAAHPFAVDGDALADLLALPPGESKVDSAVVLLPSYPGGPACSPELVRDPLTAGPPLRGNLTLRGWAVPMVTCDAVAALALLDAPAGWRPGASVHYLASVAAFADELIARGRVLPGITAEPTGWYARWRACLSGVESARFARLREAMPPALRAEQPEPDATDGRPPVELLQSLLNAMVDGRVRAALRGARLAPGGRTRLGSATVVLRDWLRALTDDPALDGDMAQIRTLADRLDAWHASAAHDSPVRTCFRLRSPDQASDQGIGAGEDWHVDFLLQATDEESVLVPAAQVWNPARRSVLHKWISRPQELLLADLGRASRIMPALDSALREPHPTGLTLDAEGAYDFLTKAARLDQAGFGVQVPSWWHKTGELGLRLTASGAGTAGTVSKTSPLGLKELVDYRWELSIGGQVLDQRELNELAEAKVPLVRFRGQWVQVDQHRLAAGIAFLKRVGTGQMEAGDVLLHSIMQASEKEYPIPVETVADGWLGDLLSGSAEQYLEPVQTPVGFAATLRPYQLRGLAWLAFLDSLGLGACLADDMGLGKTVQLLALEVLARNRTERPATLLVCPMSLVGNWQREAAKFAPMLRVHVHHGADRRSGDELAEAVDGADLVITTYAVATRDAEQLATLRFDRIVLDEAQNIKNSAARQSQVLRALPARHRIALTGTPVENRLAELWSIMDFANPGILGTITTFRNRFAVPVERYGDQEAAARLRKVTGPFVLRRVKTDPAIIDDLPEKLEMRQLCTLTAEQASLYQAVLDDMLAKIEESEGMERRGLVLATMSKLKQVCNHPAQLLGDGSRIAGRSGKLERLEQILDEALADGDKALCFTQFAQFGGMLVPHLAARFDTEVLFLHGGTSRAAREQMVTRFQSEGGPSIFLLSLKAGGTGLTLTAANHVIHLDRWWNPAVEDQATDRAFRIGQKRNVQVRKFVCIGTLEEKIDSMIEEKKALAQLAVGVGENWLTELSTRELRELVSLSPEAIGE